MTDPAHQVTGGVDTHKDTHVAAVLDGLGRLLGTESFPATAAGYQRLFAWLRGFGEITAVGIEGTGVWGAGSKNSRLCAVRSSSSDAFV
jgi:transposase